VQAGFVTANCCHQVAGDIGSTLDLFTNPLQIDFLDGAALELYRDCPAPSAALCALPGLEEKKKVTPLPVGRCQRVATVHASEHAPAKARRRQLQVTPMILARVRQTVVAARLELGSDSLCPARQRSVPL